MRKLMILLLAFVSMAIFAQVGQVNIDEIAKLTGLHQNEITKLSNNL